MQTISDKQIIINLLKNAGNWPSIEDVIYSTAPKEAELFADTHPKVRLVIPVEGSYLFKYYNHGLKETSINPGQLLYIDKNGVLINTMETKCKLLTVIFWDTYTRYLISERNFQHIQNYWYHTGASISIAAKHLIHCLSELCQKKQFIESDKMLFKPLIEFSCQELLMGTGDSSGKAYNTYLFIKDYMHQHLHENSLNRATLAGKVGLTPSHISKLFQHFDHNCFNNSLQQLRIERACQLLNNHKLTIKETASQCGFTNTTHFIKVFKKFQELSPGEYRNRMPVNLPEDQDYIRKA